MPHSVDDVIVITNDQRSAADTKVSLFFVCLYLVVTPLCSYMMTIRGDRIPKLAIL